MESSLQSSRLLTKSSVKTITMSGRAQHHDFLGDSALQIFGKSVISLAVNSSINSGVSP
jgi:hypothetical protein